MKKVVLKVIHAFGLNEDRFDVGTVVDPSQFPADVLQGRLENKFLAFTDVEEEEVVAEIAPEGDKTVDTGAGEAGTGDAGDADTGSEKADAADTKKGKAK